MFYVGFMELSDSRQIGMGTGSIPWMAVHAYCKFLELNDEQSDAMHYHIREMDIAYIEHLRKKK